MFSSSGLDFRNLVIVSNHGGKAGTANWQRRNNQTFQVGGHGSFISYPLRYEGGLISLVVSRKVALGATDGRKFIIYHSASTILNCRFRHAAIRNCGSLTILKTGQGRPKPEFLCSIAIILGGGKVIAIVTCDRSSLCLLGMPKGSGLNQLSSRSSSPAN